MLAAADGCGGDEVAEAQVDGVRPGWLRGVDDVAWGSMSHAFGTAEDVPGLLAGLAEPDPGKAWDNFERLRETVRHQGGTTMPAAAAVPFLIRGAAEAGLHHRGALLGLAADAGRRNYFGQDDRAQLLVVGGGGADHQVYDVSGSPVVAAIHAARAALAANVPALLELLGDGDPDVRAHAAYAVSALPIPQPEVEAALARRLAAEAEPGVRAALILARATLGPVDAEPLWSDPGNPADVRFAAAVVWLGSTPAPPPDALLDLLATPETEEWLARVPWCAHEYYRPEAAEWLVKLLNAPGPQAGLVRRLPHGVPATTAAYHVAARWRSAYGEMMTVLGDHLAHPDPDVVRAAARCLADAGAVPAEVADRLAEVVGHDDREARGWATVALANRGDARAVAPLATLLRAPEPPWGDALPPMGVNGLTLRLRAHAGELLPAVIHYLTTGGWAYTELGLIDGLIEWGEAAAPAVDALCRRLSDEAAVRALGAIGPAAARAVPLLDTTTPAGAWARWRITGERAEETAAALAEARAMHLLADLGPAAAPHLGTIRQCLAEGGEWTRVEAAGALWRATGEADEAVRAFADVLRTRWLGVFGPRHATIARYAAEIGPAARPLRGFLARFLDRDGRVEGIAQEQRWQALARRALASIDDPGA